MVVSLLFFKKLQETLAKTLLSIFLVKEGQEANQNPLSYFWKSCLYSLLDH